MVLLGARGDASSWPVRAVCVFAALTEHTHGETRSIDFTDRTQEKWHIFDATSADEGGKDATCSILHIAAQHSKAKHNTAHHSTTQHSTALRSLSLPNTTQHRT